MSSESLYCYQCGTHRGPQYPPEYNEEEGRICPLCKSDFVEIVSRPRPQPSRTTSTTTQSATRAAPQGGFGSRWRSTPPVAHAESDSQQPRLVSRPTNPALGFPAAPSGQGQLPTPLSFTHTITTPSGSTTSVAVRVLASPVSGEGLQGVNLPSLLEQAGAAPGSAVFGLQLNSAGSFGAPIPISLGDFADGSSLDQILDQLAQQHLPSTNPAAREVVEALPKLEVPTAPNNGDDAATESQANSGSDCSGRFAAVHAGEPCSICHSAFEAGETVTQLHCHHCFHGECIHPWLQSQNTCPICRAELPRSLETSGPPAAPAPSAAEESQQEPAYTAAAARTQAPYQDALRAQERELEAQIARHLGLRAEMETLERQRDSLQAQHRQLQQASQTISDLQIFGSTNSEGLPSFLPYQPPLSSGQEPTGEPVASSAGATETHGEPEAVSRPTEDCPGVRDILSSPVRPQAEAGSQSQEGVMPESQQAAAGSQRGGRLFGSVASAAGWLARVATRRANS